MDEIQSIIPSYFELGRINPESPTLFKGLEDRFKEIKSQTLTNEKDDDKLDKFKERAVIIQSYFEKIQAARAAARVGQKESDNDEIGFQSEDEGESKKTE